jgi:hypothetical protein
MASPLERSLAATHRFAWTSAFRLAALPFGVNPGNARVELVGTHLVATFGRWTVSTPLANIEHAEVTGPYNWPRVIGPAHLSLTDRGLTFASNPDSGVCLTFREPVAGIDPLGWVKHPGLTVTVEDPERLVEEINGSADHLDEIERDERALLEGQTASELRAVARDLGIAGVSSMKKADLVDRILADAETTTEVVDRVLDDGSGTAA